MKQNRYQPPLHVDLTGLEDATEADVRDKSRKMRRAVKAQARRKARRKGGKR